VFLERSFPELEESAVEPVPQDIGEKLRLSLLSFVEGHPDPYIEEYVLQLA
jgi:hypothetical protein